MLLSSTDDGKKDLPVLERPRPGESRNKHKRSAVNQYPPSGKLGDIDCLWLDDSVLTQGNYVRAAIVSEGTHSMQWSL